MFNKSRNNHFKKNTSFTINTNNFNSGPGQPLDRLYDNVAPNAILNAGGRADEVRCHPGTRKEVIGLVDKWRLDIQNNITANEMFWLCGPAGAGKTAIVQTVAENWKSLEIHTANFFFFRTDPSRSHAKSFVSTLLYQIFEFFPAARDTVDQVLGTKPRILDAGLDEQVNELICNTFRSIKPPFSGRIILLIDGLDECDSEAKTSQRQILRVLDKLVQQADLPFLVLVASRPESHISAAFRQLTLQARSIFLDDRYAPAEDIRRFVEDEFKKIKKSHPLAALLPSNWPSDSDIHAIVGKSSGHFIYAATIMRFIAHSTADPSLSLAKVQGIVPCGKSSPFTHLDAVYTYILQQADDDTAMNDILSSALLDEDTAEESSMPGSHSVSNSSNDDIYTETSVQDDIPAQNTRKSTYEYDHLLPEINEFLQLFDLRYTTSLFMSCISEILSIVELHRGRLVFYHASFYDFLLDRSRSQLFYVNINRFLAKVLPQIWTHSLTLQGPGHTKENLVPLLTGLLRELGPEYTSPAITNILLTVYPPDWFNSYTADDYTETLKSIKKLYYNYDITTYKKILKHWIAWAVSMCDSEEGLQIVLDGYCEPMAMECRRRLGLKVEDYGWHGGNQWIKVEIIPYLAGYFFVARVHKSLTGASDVFESDTSGAGSQNHSSFQQHYSDSHSTHSNTDQPFYRATGSRISIIWPWSEVLDHE